MKKSILTILTLIISITLTYAQKLQPNSTVKANRTNFRITQLKYGGISIANTDNIYRDQKPKVSAWSISLYEKIKKGSMLTSFKQVFGDERLRQLTAEHILNLTLYVLPSGKVSEVSFLLNENTIVTAAELEQLENVLKNNVSFELRPEQTKGGDFFKLSIAVKYQNVIDGIER
jgi:hypothetical protein